MGFPKSSHRYSAATGLVFAALFVISGVFFGLDFPTYDDSGKTFAAYYADNASAIEMSVLLGGFSGMALIWFMGFMRWLFWGAETAARGFVRATDIGYAAGIAAVAASMITLAAQEAAVVAAGTVEPGVIRALDLFGDYAFVLAGLFLSIWLFTSFFVIRVTKVFPAWIGFVAVAGTIFGLIQSVLLLAPQDDDGIFGVVALLFLLLFVIYTVAASLTLIRRVEAIQRGR